MQTILTVAHLFLALGLIGLILIQHGRGADAGAAFGSGASATVFGARGSGSFLSRATAILATTFSVTSMALAYFSAQIGEPEGLMEGIETPAPLQTGGAVPSDQGAPPVTDALQETPPVPVPTAERVVTDVPAVPGAALPESAPAAADAPVPPAASFEVPPEPAQPATGD